MGTDGPKSHMSCLLNRGETRWRIPFGKYPELVSKGIKNTGSDNYGGPVEERFVVYRRNQLRQKFHAFDKSTGKLLWLPEAEPFCPPTRPIGNG